MVTVDTTKLIPLHSGQFFGFVQELCGAGVVVFVSLYTGDRPAGLLGSVECCGEALERGHSHHTAPSVSLR